jgi:hypothetical protein
MSSYITIDNKKYKVVDNLGYCQSRGVYAKVVLQEGKENIAIKESGGLWHFDNPVSKIRPKGFMVGQ